MKSKISQSLTHLLQHKELDKITVKELVADCAISRQTFYYHFRDIMDVVEWQNQQILNQSIARSLANYLSPVLPGVTFYEDPNQQDSQMPAAFLQQRYSYLERRTGGR